MSIKKTAVWPIKMSFNKLHLSVSGVTFNTHKSNFVVEENLTVIMNITISNACEESKSSLDIAEVSQFGKSISPSFCTLFHEHGSCVPSINNPHCTCDPQTQPHTVKTKVRCSRGERDNLKTVGNSRKQQSLQLKVSTLSSSLSSSSTYTPSPLSRLYHCSPSLPTYSCLSTCLPASTLSLFLPVSPPPQSSSSTSTFPLSPARCSLGAAIPVS